MNHGEHYLKRELYDLIRRDDTIFEFLQLGLLDGIWYWDLSAPENEWMSPRFWEILGFDPREKEHSAAEWQELIFPADLKTAVYNYIRHCEDPEYPYDQIVRYRHKNGSTVWVRCRGVAIRDSSGKAVRMLGAHTDVTALKFTEEHLRRKSQELMVVNQKLLEAMNEIRRLKEIIPICSHCKKIRDGHDEWISLERYVSLHTGSLFSHGVCPGCKGQVVKDLPN